jgi:hypothetical protein
MDQTLKEHKELIDEHNVELKEIQQDITDIKVRLGIKDLTNGQVVQYQKDLVKSIEVEKAERKEQDAVLRNDIKSVDNKTWFIVTGIIVLGIMAILELLLQVHFGA